MPEKTEKIETGCRIIVDWGIKPEPFPHPYIDISLKCEATKTTKGEGPFAIIEEAVQVKNLAAYVDDETMVLTAPPDQGVGVQLAYGHVLLEITSVVEDGHIKLAFKPILINDPTLPGPTFPIPDELEPDMP